MIYENWGAIVWYQSMDLPFCRRFNVTDIIDNHTWWKLGVTIW